MRLFATTLVAAAALGAASAHAQNAGLQTSPLSGFYIGGNVGGGNYKGNSVGGLETGRSDFGLKLHGGYSFTPNLAIEAGYADLGRFHSGAGSVKADGWFLDGVGTLPVYDKLSVLGRVGVFNGRQRSSLQGSDSGTNIKVGAGLQYDISQRVNIRGEWERYRFDTFGSHNNTDLYSVGLNYKF
jgi:OmpA-OmpF porin, OOP family